jgi:cation diffusion facilitator CzcD-associated flavoprotein CzcO
MQDTVEKFGLQGFFKLNHEVVSCDWDENEAKWLCKIRRADGSEFIDKADVLLNTSGPVR